ncbi:MAG: FxsA family protein [Rhodospirillaceae bacterium]
MPLVILSLFIAVPVIEIAVFIKVGGILGLWPTIALVLLTAIGGISLMRAQGLATLQRAQASIERGEAPLREVFDGACLLIAGMLLLTPGFVTDTLGLILFLPPVRSAVFNWLGGAVRAGKIHVRGGGFGQHRPGPPPGQGPLDIEGDYRDVTPPDDPPDAPPRIDRK